MSNNPDLSTPQLRVTVENDIALLSPNESLFLGHQAKEMSTIIHKLFDQNITRYVFDLADCTYISSEGLGVFAAWWRFCHEQNKGAMVVVLPDSPNNEVANLFDIIGLSRMIGSAIQPTVKDALNYLKEFK
jgi:anti-anti-sigma factor